MKKLNNRLNNKSSSKKKIKANGVKKPVVSKEKVLKSKKINNILEDDSVSGINSILKEKSDVLSSNDKVVSYASNDDPHVFATEKSDVLDNDPPVIASEKTNVSDNDSSSIAIEETMEKSAKHPKMKKINILYDLLIRRCGANMEELSKELNWKKSSLRGVLSNLQKQRGFTLLSLCASKPKLDDNGNVIGFKKETRYFIKERYFDLSSLSVLI
jgi:hypothetical protein